MYSIETKKLTKKFKDKTFMFLKDSDNFPYGPKSKEELITIGQNCINQLLKYYPNLSFLIMNLPTINLCLSLMN